MTLGTMFAALLLMTNHQVPEINPSQVVLFKAYYGRGDEIEDEDCGFKNLTSQYAVDLRACVSARVNVYETLIGHIRKGPMRTVMQIGGEPKSGIPLVILGKIMPSNEIYVLSWNFAWDPFCVDDRTKQMLGIEKSIQRLYRVGKLRCPPEDH